ncbi:MAG: 30S ribosomal protein S6 [Alphaproteobacteria bacterium]|nr:30S ribosomal protein S6 [Alphaproteobacteria bacterium]
MPLYETTMIVRQDAAKSDATKLADNFSTIITDMKGKVEKNEYWGLRTLSYIINKNRKGHYIHLNIDAEPAAIKEMERKMRLDDNVIRHMTIRVEEFTETPGSVSGNSSYDEAA